MKIGRIALSLPTVLAPMAGVTDLAFRLLVKEMGCGLVVSEMVSVKGLLYENCRTVDLIRIEERERPIAIQIFGSDPKLMAQGAQMVVDAGADIVDINMGCPTPKITKNGEGSALLKNPALAGEIMQAVVKAVGVPVTVKIRKGWDEASVNAVEMARIAEAAGIAAITVHGRTREQFYAGKADWNIITAVKAAVSMPVIGNGDIRTPQDAAKMLTLTGCDGIMIGRGAQGNPWLFHQVEHYLQTGEVLGPPAPSERIRLMLRHLEMLVELKGAYIGVREMRRHAAWYMKGLPHAAELRAAFNQAEAPGDFAELIEHYNGWSEVH